MLLSDYYRLSALCNDNDVRDTYDQLTIGHKQCTGHADKVSTGHIGRQSFSTIYRRFRLKGQAP